MIPFIDLQAQYDLIQDRVEAAMLATMRAGKFIMGPEVARLEARLAQFAGTRHCISCASGTDALVMALMAKGIGPGDAVFTVPFTFMASAEAIANVGATPIFVDIDPCSFNLDPASLARAIDALERRDATLHPLPRWDDARLAALTPRAVIAVDLFGLPADYPAINAIAAERGLTVIEDAAQSFGGAIGAKRAGALGDIGCTSFFPAKPLGCYGDGGALFTDDDALDAVLRSIRVHGQGTHKYDNVRLGIAGRLDTVQAAVLDVKLDIFETELADRRRVADVYGAALAGLDPALIAPVVPDGYASAWAQYTVTVRDGAMRDAMQRGLAEAGIPTMIYYPKALHMQQAFAPLGYGAGDFAVSEDLATRVFSVPMHPYLSDDEARRIAGVMRTIADSAADPGRSRARAAS